MERSQASGKILTRREQRSVGVPDQQLPGATNAVNLRPGLTTLADAISIGTSPSRQRGVIAMFASKRRKLTLRAIGVTTNGTSSLAEI